MYFSLKNSVLEIGKSHQAGNNKSMSKQSDQMVKVLVRIFGNLRLTSSTDLPSNKIKDLSQLIHKGNIDISLTILNDFGSFSHLNTSG